MPVAGPPPGPLTRFCTRCGSPGPFNTATGLICDECKRRGAEDNRIYRKLDWAARLGAYKRLAKAHPTEFSRLLMEERLRVQEFYASHADYGTHSAVRVYRKRGRQSEAEKEAERRGELVTTRDLSRTDQHPDQHPAPDS